MRNPRYRLKERFVTGFIIAAAALFAMWLKKYYEFIDRYQPKTYPAEIVATFSNYILVAGFTFSMVEFIV